MKKMLSLAAMFAVLSYASPAQAELKIGGDAGVRVRSEFKSTTDGDNHSDDVNFQYRIRLKAAADLGSGYFFKAMVMNENANIAGGWQKISENAERIELDVSNFYFGRMMADSHYMMGRLPLNSFNNPAFDLTLYPMQPLDQPVFNINFDRVYGLNYGAKLGNGEANATLVVLDNNSTVVSDDENDGLFNDGYALHLVYKTTVGDVTIEPQVLTVLTKANIRDQDNVIAYSTGTTSALYNLAENVTPVTFGANASMPVGDAKVSCSAFYTICDDTNDGTVAHAAQRRADYHGALLRLKGESGPVMAWVDYSASKDKVTDTNYSGTFVWAQYKYSVYESAAGSFTLQPTLRWLATSKETIDTDVDNSTFRTELWATVSF